MERGRSALGAAGTWRLLLVVATVMIVLPVAAGCGNSGTGGESAPDGKSSAAVSGESRVEGRAEPGLEIRGENMLWLIPVDVQDSVETPFVVASVGGFGAEKVTLSISGLPPGVRAEFNPPVVSVPPGGQAESALIVYGSQKGFDEDTDNKWPLKFQATGGGATATYEADLLLLCH